MILVNANRNAELPILEITIIAVTLLSLLLVVWYKRHIEKDYIDKTHEQTVTWYEAQINDLVADNEKKDERNEKLGGYVHRDVAIMPDLIEGYGILANTHKISEAEIHYKEIKALYDERQGTLDETETEVKFPDLQHGILKSAAKQIYKIAKTNGVEFGVEKFADTSSWFNLVKIYNFHLILQYLCRNAVYATKGCQNAKVLARFGKESEALPCIKIFDNGVAFDLDVIEKMGLMHVTSHSNDGGSGYGLHTVFEYLQEYKASFILDEWPENCFSKSIEIIFDGRQRVAVRTNRQSVIKICQKRGFEVEFVQDLAA